MNAKWQLATAAEAFAAARFARLGCNVSVQYGANQPEYDLMIDKAGEVLKVSVKGSGNGGWGLSQSQLAKLGEANYHGAAEAWFERHKPGTVLCLVQFKGTQPDECRGFISQVPERSRISCGRLPAGGATPFSGRIINAVQRRRVQGRSNDCPKSGSSVKAKSMSCFTDWPANEIHPLLAQGPPRHFGLARRDRRHANPRRA